MNLSKSVGIAALFLIIFLSGYGLHRSGKPYHTLLFNLHKLVSLEKPAPAIVARAHKLLPYLTAASSAAAWVFLTR